MKYELRLLVYILLPNGSDFLHVGNFSAHHTIFFLDCYGCQVTEDTRSLYKLLYIGGILIALARLRTIGSLVGSFCSSDMSLVSCFWLAFQILA